MRLFDTSRILSLLTVLLLVSCSRSKSNASSNILVIQGANLMTMENDEIHTDQTIIIVGDRIKSIHHANTVDIPKGATVINAKGKYVIPGLADMHMHIDHPDVLKVNLAFGITTVMNYRGLPEHLLLREKARRNQIFSPSIYTTGDYMEGYPGTMPGFQCFTHPEEAREAVRKNKEMGYDFIKVYRNLDTLLHKAICDEAKKNDLAVVGHLSPKIGLEQSLSAGQKVIAHAEEVMYFFNNENDSTRIDDLIGLFKTYGTTFTPNLTILKSLPIQVTGLDSINAQEHMKFLQPAIFQSWRKSYNVNFGRGKVWAKFMTQRSRFLQHLTNELRKNGIQILASTDAPTSGAFPGIAVHQELEEFVKIGFTPYEALKTATIEPGKFIQKYLGPQEKFGIVKEGYRADLLLLEKNPLVDIKNTNTISSVVKRGQWYPQDSIDQELHRLNELYQEVGPRVKSIEQAISNEDVALATEIYNQSKSEFEHQLFLGYYTMWYAGYNFLYESRKLTEDPERAKKAIAFYTMYLDQYPEMHGSHYLLGMAHKANKDTINAIKSFKKSLEFHPHNPYAKRRLEELKEGVKE